MKQAFIGAILCVSLAVTAHAQKAFKTTLPQQEFADRDMMPNATKNGLKEGYWCSYFSDINSMEPTGAMDAKYCVFTIYNGGKQNGRERQFDMDGKLVSENTYYDGKVSEMKSYNDNGKLYLETGYSDGKKNGMEREYLPNGVLYRETPFAFGNENGVERIYYDDGKIEFENSYVQGNIESSKHFKKDGNLISIDYWKTKHKKHKAA